jgi:hypothetical protein
VNVSEVIEAATTESVVIVFDTLATDVPITLVAVALNE